MMPTTAIVWMDKIHFTPAEKLGNDEFPVLIRNGFPWFLRWCEMDFVLFAGHLKPTPNRALTAGQSFPRSFRESLCVQAHGELRGGPSFEAIQGSPNGAGALRDVDPPSRLFLLLVRFFFFFFPRRVFPALSLQWVCGPFLRPKAAPGKFLGWPHKSRQAESTSLGGLEVRVASCPPPQLGVELVKGPGSKPPTGGGGFLSLNSEPRDDPVQGSLEDTFRNHLKHVAF